MFEHLRNEIIRSKTKVIDIQVKARNSTMKWAGHIARMENNKWTKKATEWTPKDGNRTRGRPKRRWRDELEETGGKLWTRMAHDREEWRDLWRPSASSGVKRL